MKAEALPPIVVIYGGPGMEREVSLVSGKAVLDALGQVSGLRVRGHRLEGTELTDDYWKPGELVLLVLHGEFGEDGQVQGLMEARGIPYCGCDAVSSRLCMNKERTKQRVAAAGIPVVPGIELSSEGVMTADDLILRLGDSLVAKPVSMGSSVGLRLIDGRTAIADFLDHANGSDWTWLLEQRIRGREFSIGVLDGKAMGVVEIVIPDGRVYDYEQKYHRADTRYECPANLPTEEYQRLQRFAEAAFESCGCRDYARVDFLRDGKSGESYFLEINTLPGMTPTSLLPKSAKAVGHDFTGLLLHMALPGASRMQNRPAAQ